MQSAEATKPAGTGSEFSAEQFKELDRWIEEYRGKSGGVIRALTKAQEIFGYLPKDVQAKIASGMGRTASEVFGIATFYSFFSLVPKGKHTVCTCQGTACYVRGGKQVMQELQDSLNVGVGGTTADREFSLESVRCMGACALAPVVRVDDDVYRQVTPKKLKGILSKYSQKYGSGGV